MNLQKALAAVRAEPNDAQSWVTLGKVLSQHEKPEEARDSFQRALFLDPSLEHVYDELLDLEARATLPAWLSRLEEQRDQEAAQGNGHIVETPVRRGNRRRRLLVPLALLLLLLGVGLSAGVFWSFRSVSDSPVVAGEPPSQPEVRLPLSVAGRGLTLEEAVPVGESLLVRNGMQYTVLSINPDATDQVYPDAKAYFDEYEGGDEPWAAGYHPYMLWVRLENKLGQDPQSLLFLGSFRLRDESGQIYDDSCRPTPVSLTGLSDLALGERTEGNLCILVADDAKIEYLIYEEFFGDDRRFVGPLD